MWLLELDQSAFYRPIGRVVLLIAGYVFEYESARFHNRTSSPWAALKGPSTILAKRPSPYGARSNLRLTIGF